MRMFLRPWALTTAGTALVMSSVDAALLQRSRGFFTGGFLSVDHLSGATEIVTFVIVSLLVDAAIVGLLAALALVVIGRWRGTRNAAIAAAVMLALGPLLAAEAINYEIARYLGPAFDLGLMFDLTGRSVAEFWAVASSHLWMPVLTVTAVIGAGVGMLWLINRAGGPLASAATGRDLMVPLALALAAAAALTVAASASESLSNGLLRKPSGQALQAAVTLATDVDRDGYGVIGRLSDPDALNGSVFPYAVDVPGNGVDEDGVAGDLPSGAPAYGELPRMNGRFARSPDVLLVVLESFRADLIGAQFGGKPITPVLNALAARGLAAPRAYSHNGYTVQSRFHLLAGTLASQPDTPTLVDDFKANGYLTASFSGQDELFGGREYRVGFDRADVWFDARAAVDRRYTTFSTPGSLAVAHDVVQEQIDAFLAARAFDDRPLFLYVGFGDTHFPYSHPDIDTLVSDVRLGREQITPDRRDRLWATYANTAANVDRAIGVLIDRMRAARRHEPAIVITSDHGESLFDAAFLGHGHGLDDVQTRVPLIVANLAMDVPDPFSQIDFRHALTRALMSAGESAGPRLVGAGDRPVLQYLGDLRRPRQIAFLHADKRFIYDFRTGRAQAWGGEWLRPDALPQSNRITFERLIHQWEWINLSLRRGRDRDAE